MQSITQDSKAPTPVPSEIPEQSKAYDVDLQPPFQSGSTPSRLQARYLVWNSVGIVISNEDDESINVDFHDISTHHSVHLRNSHNFTMCDLSTEMLVLACEANEETFAPSRIMGYNFAALEENKGIL